MASRVTVCGTGLALPVNLNLKVCSIQGLKNARPGDLDSDSVAGSEVNESLIIDSDSNAIYWGGHRLAL